MNRFFVHHCFLINGTGPVLLVVVGGGGGRRFNSQSGQSCGGEAPLYAVNMSYITIG